MLIDLKKSKFYFLTCNNEKRRLHILEEFKEYNLTEVNPTTHSTNYKSGASGFIKMLELGLKNQDLNKPFQPFVLLEDDATKYRDFPQTIEIPDETDILYIGLSKCGMIEDKWSFSVFYSNINNDLIRVYNMLSLHGLIICSPTGLSVLQLVFNKALENNTPWDVPVAHAQPHYNMYALRIPLVYQLGELGGEEALTKIECQAYENVCINNYNDLLQNIHSIFFYYGNIEKKIHISWKNKNILDANFSLIQNGIKKLKDMNHDYSFEISDDIDVENYIKNNISNEDYELIKNKHIVEKIDLWRILKIYNEGGIYIDIDRLVNISLDKIITNNVKCILPMHYDIDFAQDIMISCSKNIIYKRTIELNLQRRKEGWTDVLSLGPITYFHAVTEILLGKQINRYPNHEDLEKLRYIINNSEYLKTYREEPPFNTLLYKGPEILFDKNELYNYSNVVHWVSICGNDPLNKPGGQ